MLYVYFGNDVARVRQKAFDFIHTLTAKGVVATPLTSDTYKEGILTDFAEATSLFGEVQAVIIDTPSEDASVFEDVFKQLKVLNESENHFVIIEGSLNAAQKKTVLAHATKSEELTADKKEKFNAFLLTDAFLRRDKKSLWLLLMEAWKEGLSNEEIIGVLFWQVKILRLAERTKTPEEAEQKPFVYSKAKRALSNFKKGELDALATTLLSIYHEGHLGKHDTGIALEKWVLGL